MDTAAVLCPMSKPLEAVLLPMKEPCMAAEAFVYVSMSLAPKKSTTVVSACTNV